MSDSENSTRLRRSAGSDWAGAAADRAPDRAQQATSTSANDANRRQWDWNGPLQSGGSGEARDWWAKFTTVMLTRGLRAGHWAGQLPVADYYSSTMVEGWDVDAVDGMILLCSLASRCTAQ